MVFVFFGVFVSPSMFVAMVVMTVLQGAVDVRDSAVEVFVGLAYHPSADKHPHVSKQDCKGIGIAFLGHGFARNDESAYGGTNRDDACRGRNCELSKRAVHDLAFAETFIKIILWKTCLGKFSLRKVLHLALFSFNINRVSHFTIWKGINHEWHNQTIDCFHSRFGRVFRDSLRMRKARTRKRSRCTA
jgi:hypothetical protein